MKQLGLEASPCVAFVLIRHRVVRTGEARGLNFVDTTLGLPPSRPYRVGELLEFAKLGSAVVRLVRAVSSMFAENEEMIRTASHQQPSGDPGLTGLVRVTQCILVGA